MVVAGTSAARETTRDVDIIFRLRGGAKWQCLISIVKMKVESTTIRRRSTILCGDRGVFRFTLPVLFYGYVPRPPPSVTARTGRPFLRDVVVGYKTEKFTLPVLPRTVLEWSYLGRAQTASALQRAVSVHSCKSTLTWGGRGATASGSLVS